MTQYFDLLLAEATGEDDPSVLREIKQILDEPQMQGYLGEPRRGARAANDVRQIRRKQ